MGDGSGDIGKPPYMYTRDMTYENAFLRMYSPSFKFSISLHIFIVPPILLQEIHILSFYWTIIANAKNFEKNSPSRNSKKNNL